MIVAARNRDVDIPDSLGIEVVPLDSESSFELLRCLIQSSGLDDSAREVVDYIGGHPLAISSAAEYMNRHAMPCDEYLQIRKTQNEQFHPSDPRIQRIFETSLALLSADAQRLIECMALMDSDQIFEELFLQDLEGVIIMERYVIESNLK